MFIRSIRWRFLVWLAFLLLCLLTGFGVTVYQLNRISRFSQLDDELERRVVMVSADARGRLPFPPPFFRGPRREGEPGPPPRRELRGPDGPEGSPGRKFDDLLRSIELSERTLGLFQEADTNDFYYAIWSPVGTLLKSSSNAPPSVTMPASLERDTSIHMRTLDNCREAYHFTELRECILVGHSVTEQLVALKRFAMVLCGVGAIVLGIGLGGGWLLATQALQPVEQIGATASRISSGKLSERIDITETEGELGRLAGVLNSTFARLESAFAQQRQFTADASHELRTPLAVMISETQTALARERTPGEYRETVQVCLQTAQQMRQLTESLMKLARLDAGQEILDSGPFNLAQVTEACVELVRALAEQQQLSISADLHPARAVGDPDRMGQVVTNLLSNAVQFTGNGGRIDVKTGMENGSAIVEVRDTGQGIAPDDIPHIFERFYRADKSRSRSDGHAGLGLAISKAIVDAHNGTIQVSSQPGVGTTFKVSIPAADSQAN